MGVGKKVRLKEGGQETRVQGNEPCVRRANFFHLAMLHRHVLAALSNFSSRPTMSSQRRFADDNDDVKESVMLFTAYDSVLHASMLKPNSPLPSHSSTLPSPPIINRFMW